MRILKITYDATKDEETREEVEVPDEVITPTQIQKKIDINDIIKLIEIQKKIDINDIIKLIDHAKKNGWIK